MRLQKSLLSTLYYMVTESSLSEPDFKYIAIFINNDFYGITEVYFRICIFYVQCVTGAQRISLIAATLRSGFCYYLRPIGNRSLIGSGNEGQRPEKRLYLWPGRCFRYRRPRKVAIFWPRWWQTKKRHPSKECLCNIYTITRRISAASSASARCSQNIEAAGTPSPILLPQAAALQKPTGLFADRLRP